MAATPIDVMAEFLPTLEAYDRQDGLANLRSCKVIAITGDRDTTLPRSHGQNIADNIPGAEFWLVPGVGHLSQLERPDFVNAKLDSLVPN